MYVGGFIITKRLRTLASLKYMRSSRLQRDPKSREIMGSAPDDGISNKLASQKYMRSFAHVCAPPALRCCLTHHPRASMSLLAVALLHVKSVGLGEFHAPAARHCTPSCPSFFSLHAEVHAQLHAN
jgi:hypothetical protein